MRAVVRSDSPLGGILQDEGRRFNRTAGRIPAGFVTRGMAREQLGISEQQFAYLESKGFIQIAHVDERTGWRLYSRTALEALSTDRKRNFSGGLPYSGEQGKTVFALLEAGTPLAQIVLTTGFHPHIVRAVVTDYEAMSGSILLGRKHLSTINALPLNGEIPVPDADAVVDMLVRYATARCSACKSRAPSGRCDACTRDKLMQDAEARVRAARANGAPPEASPGPNAPIPPEAPPPPHRAGLGRRVERA